MRNIFLFIRRYFNFLFFLVLQIIALSFLFRYNKFHEAAFMGFANEVTGRIGERYSNIEYYFHLKQENESLARRNEILLNQMNSNFLPPDTSVTAVRDTILVDSVKQGRRYLWLGAKVVNNSVALQNNYITINRGSNQGVFKEMGVISSDGIVGSVVNTSENFAVVMTVLNRQSSVSGKIKKSGDFGRIQWDGESPYFLTMVNVPKSVEIVRGDTVVTSGFSLKFPENIMIGTVDKIVEDNSTNFYVLKIRPATNFFNVGYVYVVNNLQKEEQKKLEEATRRTNE